MQVGHCIRAKLRHGPSPAAPTVLVRVRVRVVDIGASTSTSTATALIAIVTMPLFTAGEEVVQAFLWAS